MPISSILNKMASGGLILAMAGHAAGPIPLAATAYIAQIAFASSAIAAPQAKRNAQGLLSDMRVSLGMIAQSYKETSGSRHRSTANVLEGVTRAARANQKLEDALASRNGKAIAEATGNLSRAISELQTRYALTPAQNKQAAQGMRYLNAAWKTYSSRFILSKPGNEAKSVDKAEVRALRGKMAVLEKRVASLEDQVSTNATLRRQVVRLRQDLAYYDNRPDDYWTYQHMLLTLTIVSGSFDALVYTTKVYYPTYYVYFEPIGPEFYISRSYWDGYYDGYYDGRNSVWYDEPATIDGPLIEINQIEVNQEITYQTIYNITEESRVEYEALPQENLTEVDVPEAPEDTIVTSKALIQDEDNGATPQVDVTDPAVIEPNSNSSQPDEKLDTSLDVKLDAEASPDIGNLSGNAKKQDSDHEDKSVPDNHRDNASDKVDDSTQKRDSPLLESDEKSEQTSEVEQPPKSDRSPVTAPAVVDPDSNSPQPDEKLDTSSDIRPDAEVLPDINDRSSDTPKQDSDHEDESVSDNHRNDASDKANDSPQQDDSPLSENDAKAEQAPEIEQPLENDQAPVVDQGSEQQAEPQSDGSGSVKCSDDSDNC